MIAIDTNVVLRYLCNDDPVQSQKATSLINDNHKVLITDIVLCETLWVLEGKRYRLEKEKIVDVIHALFAEPNIQFEDPHAVWAALKDYMNARPAEGKTKTPGFPDALIINKAKRHCLFNNEHFARVFTFDKAMLELDETSSP